MPRATWKRAWARGPWNRWTSRATWARTASIISLNASVIELRQPGWILRSRRLCRRTSAARDFGSLGQNSSRALAALGSHRFHHDQAAVQRAHQLHGASPSWAVVSKLTDTDQDERRPGCRQCHRRASPAEASGCAARPSRRPFPDRAGGLARTSRVRVDRCVTYYMSLLALQIQRARATTMKMLPPRRSTIVSSPTLSSTAACSAPWRAPGRCA